MEMEEIARWAYIAFIVITIVMGLAIGYMVYNADPAAADWNGLITPTMLISGIIIGIIGIKTREVTPPFLICIIMLMVAIIGIDVRTGIASAPFPIIGLIATTAEKLKTGKQKHIQTLQIFRSVDRVIYARVRFLVLEKLIIMGSASFGRLLKSLREELPDLTNGNLSGHITVLEETKYIKAKRFFKGRKPQVTYSITAKGKEAFELFLTMLIGRLKQSQRAVTSEK